MTIRRGLLVLGLFVAGVSIAQAQASLLRFQTPYVDYELSAPPCASVHPVVPVVAENAIWFAWTCNDGRVIMRGPRPQLHAQQPQALTCDPMQMIGVTGLNECQWKARYPR